MRNNTTAVADRLGILPEYRSAFLNMSMNEEEHKYIVPGFMERQKEEPFDYILWESVTTKIQNVYNKDYKKKNIEDTVQAYREGVEKYGHTKTKDGSEYFVVPCEDIDGIDEVATEAVQKNLDWYGTRGTNIHTAIETHDINGEYGPYVQAVDAWFDSHDHVGELLAHEVMIYHPTGKYAGTIDGVGVGPDGGLIIWDYKSGKKAPDHLIQLGGYASALKELTGKDVKRGYVCYLKDYLRPPKAVYMGRDGVGCRPYEVKGLDEGGMNVKDCSWILGLDYWKRSKPWE